MAVRAGRAGGNQFNAPGSKSGNWAGSWAGCISEGVWIHQSLGMAGRLANMQALSVGLHEHEVPRAFMNRSVHESLVVGWSVTREAVHVLMLYFFLILGVLLCFLSTVVWLLGSFWGICD